MAGTSRATYYLELANSASNAATAIDNHLLGQDSEWGDQAIEKLTKDVYEISRGSGIETEFIMDYVLWPEKRGWIGKTIDDTRLHTWLFAKDLETLTEFSEERQIELEGVCLELSRQAMNHFERYMKSYRMGLVA